MGVEAAEGPRTASRLGGEWKGTQRSGLRSRWNWEKPGVIDWWVGWKKLNNWWNILEEENEDGIKMQKWLGVERSRILFFSDKKEVGKMSGNKTGKVKGMHVVGNSFIWKLWARVRIGGSKNLEEFGNTAIGKCNRGIYLGKSWALKFIT